MQGRLAAAQLFAQIGEPNGVRLRVLGHVLEPAGFEVLHLAALMEARWGDGVANQRPVASVEGDEALTHTDARLRAHRRSLSRWGRCALPFSSTGH